MLSGVQEFTSAHYRPYHYNTQSESFISLVKNRTYNLQLRRLTDFVLFDLYSQGIARIKGEFWGDYADFLNMQIKFYGKIVEKYPKNFKTMHDIVTLKFNNLKDAEACQNFEERTAEIAELAYKGREYSIVIPTQPQELAEEGVALSHCVKDYIKRVAAGECHILFLRKTVTPDVSLVTVQLSGNVICQAQGLNRRPITAEERKFLTRWAQHNNLDIVV